MSITFRPNCITQIPSHIRVSCIDECAPLTFDATDEGATLAYDIHVCGVCGDQAFHITEYVGEELPEVNLSNSNAAQVIERLGLTFDYCGEIDADELLASAALGNVGRDDSGEGSVLISAPGAARMIDCGRPAGYFGDVMDRLVEVAQEAKTRGVEVIWC